MNDTILSTDGMSWFSILGIGAIVVVVLALLFWFLNRRGHMAFMRGGSNRQPRLAVLDAAAVDSRRRLVLVRRDNVEHLILIGGTTDIVVESGIYRTKATQADGTKQAAAKQPNPKTLVRPGKPRQQPEAQASEQQTAPAPKAIAMEPLDIPKTPENKAPEKTPEPKSPEPVTMPVENRGPAAQQTPPAQKPPVVSAPQLAAVAAATATSAVSAPPQRESANVTTANSGETAPVRTATRQMPAEPAAPATPNMQRDVTAEFEDVFDAAPEPVVSPSGPDVEPGGGEPETDPWLAMVAAQQKTTEHASPFIAPAVDPATSPASPPVNEANAPNISRQSEPARPSEPPRQKVSPEELIADFDKVLEAEINRSEQDANEIAESNAATKPDNNADKESQSGSLEDEMKKMLGGLSPKQD